MRTGVLTAMMTTYDKTNKVVVFVIRKLEICNAQRKY